MHEYGIACEIARIACDEAARNGGGRVTVVRLLVGVLRGVVPEQLAFLFGHASEGSAAEGARLVIEEEPVTIACAACGDVPAAEFTLVCPRCGGPADRVSGGDALRILSLEIED